VQAVVTDPVRPTQAMERLRSRFPHTLLLSFEPRGGGATDRGPARRLTGRSDHEVALEFFRDVRATPADEAEAALLLEACDACRLGASGDTVVGA
jgi:exonuclease SbcD